MESGPWTIGKESSSVARGDEEICKKKSMMMILD
jgi:hypothetical protein